MEKAIQRTDDPETFSEAYLLLSNSKGSNKYAMLTEALKMGNWLSRQAIRTLARRFHGESFEVLLEATQDINPTVAGEAIHSLGQTKDPRALKPLIDLLDHPRATHAKCAAFALGNLGLPEAIPALRQAQIKHHELYIAVDSSLRTIASKYPEHAAKCLSVELTLENKKEGDGGPNFQNHRVVSRVAQQLGLGQVQSDDDALRARLKNFSHIAIDVRGSRGGNGDVAAGYVTMLDLQKRSRFRAALPHC